MKPSDSQSEDQASAVAPQKASSFWKTLAAPWALHSPARAAFYMTQGSRFAFWISYVIGTVALAVLILGLVMWEYTVDHQWTLKAGHEFRTRSFAEVWHDWHVRGAFGQAELILGLVILSAPLVTALGAWLFLPDVHRGGNGWHSYRRAFRAVASGIGLLDTLVFVSVGSIVGLGNLEKRGFSIGPELGMPTAILCLACLCLLIFWLHRAARAAAGPAIAVELALRCEGCGYDLTHQSESGRCTECGLDVRSSLAPDIRRPGCRWQRTANFGAWLSTTVAVIESPTGFYGGLKLRLPAKRADQFARWHYLAIGLYAVCFCALSIVIITIKVGEYPPAYISLVPILFFLSVPLAGWLLHRFLGTLATSWCIVRDLLPDAAWARTVLAYETAFLWAFCIFDGLLVLSFVQFEAWMSRLLVLLAISPGFGMPVEFIVMVACNAGLGLLWLLRYRTAYRNIRWSNY